MKKTHLTLIFIALSYIMVCVGMYISQTSLIFPAHLVGEATISKKYNVEDIKFTATDGTILRGITLNPQQNTEELFIVFSGNAHNAETLVQDIYEAFPNATVSGMNYRGYGRSAGTPSEKDILADSSKQVDFFIHKFSPKRTYFVGYSLGTAVVSHLLNTQKINGAILLTPFDSIAALAKHNYPYLPVGLLLKHPFDSIKHLQGNITPLAIITVKNDEIVPQKNLLNFVENVRPIVYQKELNGTSHGNLFHHKNINATLQVAKAALN